VAKRSWPPRLKNFWPKTDMVKQKEPYLFKYILILTTVCLAVTSVAMSEASGGRDKSRDGRSEVASRAAGDQPVS
jgi:hypothetical protein